MTVLSFDVLQLTWRGAFPNAYPRMHRERKLVTANARHRVAPTDDGEKLE